MLQHPQENKNDEFNILQREYRNMESNRKAFTEECNHLLTRQNKKIEKVKVENETLKADISLLQARTNLKNHNNSNTASFEQSLIDKLYLEIEKYTSSIQSEKEKIGASEQQISILRNQIRCKRKSLISVGASPVNSCQNNVLTVRENQRHLEKQLRLLENKLDQSLLKFNKLISYNKKQRQEIDDLRGERSVFEEIYNKLEKDLQEKKKQMARVIEESNFSYEQRDQAQAEMLAIEQSNLREQHIFEQQMKSLKEEVNKNILAKSSNSSKKLNQSEHSNYGEELSFEDSEQTTIACSNNEMDDQNNDFIAELTEENKLHRFQEIFSRLFSVIEVHLPSSSELSTDDTEIDAESTHNIIVNTFLTNEEQNFSLLTFANELVDQINRLQGQVHALREEEASYTTKNGNDKNQYEILLIKLENKISCLNSQKKKYMDKCMDNQETLDQLKAILFNLLNKLGCYEDDKQIKNTNEGSPEQLITDANILYYFGLLEKKTNEILTTYQYYYEALDNCYNGQQDISNKSSSSSYQYAKNKSSVDSLPPSLDIVLESKLDVIPPKISDYSSSEDDDDDVDNENNGLDNTKNETSSEDKSQRRPLSTKKDFKSKNEMFKIIPNAENSKNEFDKRVSMLRKQPWKSASSSIPSSSDLENYNAGQKESDKGNRKISTKNQKPFLVPMVQK